MNKVILTGRLTRDAELNYIGEGGTPKLSFAMAVERNYQKDKNNKKVDFINIEMLGKHCENLCQYVTKGKMILIEGELNIDKYQNQEGETKYVTKVKADRLEFISNGEKKENNNNNSNGNFEPQGLDPQGFQMIDDDDIPF